MTQDLASRTVVDGVDVLGSLSPSRASDFMSCPLLFRFRTVDKLPEPYSPDAVRGTVVHKVLEDLFDLPAASRTSHQAAQMLEPAWEAIVEAEPEVVARLAMANDIVLRRLAPAEGAGLERLFFSPRWS